MSTDATANVKNLTDSKWTRLGERYEAFQAGGGGKVERPEVYFSDAGIAARDAGVELRIERSGGTMEATLEAMELPANWRDYEKLTVELGDVPADCEMELIVLGARSRLGDRFQIESGESRRLELSLRDLPLSAGIRAAYEPTAIRLVVHGDSPISFTLRAVKLVTSTTGRPPVVDRFGQRISTHWPGKIEEETGLKEAAKAEAAQLASMVPPPDRDPPRRPR